MRHHPLKNWRTFCQPCQDLARGARTSTFFLGGDVTGEATLEAPVRAEPHPTSAGAFRDALPCGITPKELGDRYPACQEHGSVRENEHDLFLGGDVTGEATLEAPVRAEPHPTSAGAFRDALPCGITPLKNWRTFASLVKNSHVARERARFF
jgi:hypothetical protein